MLTKIKGNNTLLEPKIDFWHKKQFSICFVQKSRKFPNFELTLDYIMLRNFGTVYRPDFYENSVKSSARLEKKSRESAGARKNFHAKLSWETSRGRGGFHLPVLLGLSLFSFSSRLRFELGAGIEIKTIFIRGKIANAASISVHININLTNTLEFIQDTIEHLYFKRCSKLWQWQISNFKKKSLHHHQQ